jgi:hypothetical protein
LRESQTFDCVFIYVSSLLEALRPTARELSSTTMRDLSLKIISCIDKSKTIESYFSGTLGANESWGNLEDKRIEKSICLIVMGIVLTIECSFNSEDVRL